MRKLFHILFNKFTITGAAFVVFILFFDQNDWVSQQERHKELQSVKDNITYLNKEIAGMDQSYTELMTDPKELERYAREHYRMKRDSEDLYGIEKK